MNTQPLKQFEHAAAWTSADLLERKAEWVYQLTHDDLAELDVALENLKTNGLIIPNFGREDFPVPRLITKLQSMIERLDAGLGILQIVGLPREIKVCQVPLATLALRAIWLCSASTDASAGPVHCSLTERVASPVPSYVDWAETL